MPDPHLTTTIDGDVAIVELCGDVDLMNTDALATRILHEVPDTAAGVVLDFARLRYIDSAGIRAIFTLARRLQLREQRLAIALAEHSPLRRLLKVTRADEVGHICDDIGGAVRVLRTVE